MPDFTLVQTPFLMAPAARGLGPGLLQRATETAATTLQRALATASPGRMGATWEVTAFAGVGDLGCLVQTAAPGAKPLNNGASWPGAMPPPSALAAWAAAHGLNPFAVAKMLQARGGFAPDFGGRYRGFAQATLARVRPELLATVRADGVRAWVQALAGGGP